MYETIEITFETKDLSEVREKVKAFETLYDTSPDIFISGEVASLKKTDGSYASNMTEAFIWVLRGGWTEVRSIRNKYFSAYYDGELDEKVMPVDMDVYREVYPYNYGDKKDVAPNLGLESKDEPDIEPTKWKLEARIKM